MSRKKRCACLILCAVLLATMAFSGWKAATILAEYWQGEQIYQKIEDLSLSSLPTERKDGPNRNFDALWSLNPDVVAWLSIPGTRIDYPVVQGPDNQYYLHHMITGEWNSAGSVFLDTQCNPDFSDLCSIVYGHNMYNGTMLSNLTEYKEQEFFDNHPTGLLETPEGNWKIQFFSGFVADSSCGGWDPSCAENDFSRWAAKMAEQSCFQSGLLPMETDRVLILSTCSNEFNGARFVLLGILSVPAPDHVEK